MPNALRSLFAVLLTGWAFALAPAPAAGHDDEFSEAVAARHGFMLAVALEAGPLFDMARGLLEYDADIAADHAASLAALLRYDAGRLFVEGTSSDDLPGQTRAKAAVWEDREGFDAAFSDMREAASALAEAAGAGEGAFAEAVGGLGRTCGDCHRRYRGPAS